MQFLDHRSPDRAFQTRAKGFIIEIIVLPDASNKFSIIDFKKMKILMTNSMQLYSNITEEKNLLSND